MALNIYDPGDKYDNPPYTYPGMKWDFPEKNMNVYYIDKYPYKSKSKENAVKLSIIRKKIDILCKNIYNNKINIEKSTNNIEYINGVYIFLELHMEFIYNPINLPMPFFEIAKKHLNVSRYLLSEIPKGTGFIGLCKPKMRYIDKNLPSVGKDGCGRALYRDIFLDLDDRNLKSLVIHELAHCVCNHIQWRPNDHHADFKWAEKLITKYFPHGKLF